jgi:acyl dehydratase
MPTSLHVRDLLDAKGTYLGQSRPFVVDQARIAGFADLTEDWQWVHVDVERSKTGPFGQPIAHGYLTLSLLAPILEDLLAIEGISFAVNYGLNKVRFPTPLRAESVVRGRAKIVDVRVVPKWVEVVIRVEVTADGSDRPACVADSVLRYSPSEEL